MNRLPEEVIAPANPLLPIGGRQRRPRLKRLDPASNCDWDDLVVSHPDSSFFHGSSWARVLQASYGHTPFYLGAVEGQSLLALAPVMEVRSRLTGRRGVMLPFTDQCGLLAGDSLPGRNVISEVLEVGRRRNWRYAEFRGVREGTIDAIPSVSYFGHTLDLSASKSRIFAGFSGAVRRAVRKAEQCGVVVEISTSLEGVRAFYNLHCQTRRRHRLPPQPFSFFRRIQEHVFGNGRGCVVLARHRGRPVAAGVFVHLGGKAVYKYGASDYQLQHVRGTNLLFWEAIGWLCDRGVRVLHFGRSSKVQEGLRRFKLGFGATEHPIDYYRYDFREGRYSDATDPTFGWYNRLFGLLPLPILRMAGALLYRHLNLFPLALLWTILIEKGACVLAK